MSDELTLDLVGERGITGQKLVVKLNADGKVEDPSDVEIYSQHGEKVTLSDLDNALRRMSERIAELETGIRNFLAGDYPNPRQHRPNECKHGTNYWEDCPRCDSEYLTSLLDSGDREIKALGK